MSGSVKIRPTSRRARSSLWLTPFTPWRTRCTTCTRTCARGRSASAPRWTPSTARCCSSTSATSTSQVGIQMYSCWFFNKENFSGDTVLKLPPLFRSLCAGTCMWIFPSIWDRCGGFTVSVCVRVNAFFNPAHTCDVFCVKTTGCRVICFPGCKWTWFIANVR